MKKLTAVHQMAIWLEAEIGQFIPTEKNEYIRLIIGNAKALEKEQIEQAFKIGQLNFKNAFTNGKIYKNENEYYNETFGG